MKDPNIGNDVPFPEHGAKERAERAFFAFLSEKGEPLGLSLEKVSNRGYSIEESETEPGKHVFSIERHRSVAGCTYTRGLPMAAYQAYLQTLVFDPKSNQIHEGDEIHLGYEIDAYSMAREQMFDCNPDVEIVDSSAGLRRVSESCFNWDFEAASLEKARVWVESEVRSMYHEYSFEYLEMSDEERAKYTNQLEDACVELILSRLEEAWRDAERE